MHVYNLYYKWKRRHVYNLHLPAIGACGAWAAATTFEALHIHTLQKADSTRRRVGDASGVTVLLVPQSTHRQRSSCW